jgi:phage terminase Nu1 subunit (DNA packaging protein)
MESKNGNSCLETVITIADLSALTVVSERQLQRMVKDGVIPLAENKHGQPMRGKFVLGEAVPHFIENLRDTLVTRDPAKAAFAVDRARKMKIEADSAQLDLDEKRGEMVRVCDIEFEVTQVIRNLRDGVRAVPSKVMHRLIGLKDPREANTIVAETIDAVLRRCADGHIVDVKRWRRENRAYLRSQGFSSDAIDERVNTREQKLKQFQKKRAARRAADHRGA